MDLKSILNGFTLGEKQDSGVMSVIPLISNSGDATENMASFEDVKFLKTTNYGTMVFQNSSDKPFILPTGYSVITKQAAQDHGSTFAYLLKPNAHRSLDETCCIEQTQGGYVDGSGVNDFYLLPLYVRKKHFEQYVRSGRKNENEASIEGLSFSRLWPIISEFQNKLITEDVAHLVYFFNKFVDKLNQFNAEFETVKGQRGAIIMINNRIVGVEIAPTEEYWNVLWQRLIRDCYGSEVVRLTTLDLIKEFNKSQSNSLDLDSCKTIEEIEAAIKSHTNRYQEEIGGQLNLLLDQDIQLIPYNHSSIKENQHGDFAHHVFKVKNEKIYGEVYTEGENTVYASILL